MTQQPNLTAKQSTQRRKALLRRLGCLGTLSVFSSGVAFAETPAISPAASSVVVPTKSAAPASPVPPLAQPNSVQPNPAPALKAPQKQAVEPGPTIVIQTRGIEPQKRAVAPVPTAAGQARSSSAVAEASPSRVPVNPVLNHPTLNNPANSVLNHPAPRLPIATPSASSIPQKVAQPQVPVVTEGPSAQTIDSYEAPSSIVFSGRTSGCQFSVGKEKVTVELCGKNPAVANQNYKPSSISNAISNAVSSVIRPKFAAGEAAPVSAAPVRVGPLNLSSSGIGFTPPNITPPSFVQNYYNRTARPLGMPGNGNVSVLFPLSIPAAISSMFGWRVHPITGTQRIHTGSDLAAPMGTPVLAALTGRVIMSDFFGGYGLSVALEHTNGTQQTLYAHLSEIFVKPGDVVRQGTAIGRVGSTGASTGPHLHFEFRQQTQDGGWVAQDPGFALETAMARLVKSMQVAQAPQAQPVRRAVTKKVVNVSRS